MTNPDHTTDTDLSGTELSPERYHALVEYSSDVLILLGSDGITRYVSPSVLEVFGRQPEEVIGSTPADLVHPDDIEDVRVRLAPLIYTPGGQLQITFRARHKDGSIVWIEAACRNFADDPAVGSVVCSFRDVTARHVAEDALRRSEELFRSLTKSSPMGIYQRDLNGHCMYVNDRWMEITGRSFDDLSGHGWLNIVHPDDYDRIITDRGLDSAEFRVVRPNGEVRWVALRSSALVDDKGEMTGRIGALEDITDRKEFEARLAHQATHDPLTGLPNRTLFLDRLEGALARARRHERQLAVLFLDLDHFKVVNDSLGHSLGDMLLVDIASRLVSALRPCDTLARFGGDEFVVLCEELEDPHDAVPIAERMVDAISGSFVINDSEVFVDVSIGIAFPNSPDADPETLIRDADAAMYQAKDRGRARWVIFDHAMRAHAVERLEIENFLRRSLERRELQVFYQPIINLETGRIRGVEALVRWGHPERGLLLPGDFIAIAEETGLIMPIGMWVFDQACRQVQRWHAEHPHLEDLTLAVNLSGYQLGHSEITNEVKRVLLDTGIDPALVEMEITESVLMDDVVSSHDTLAKLKDLGVHLAIDDFGTGYSSLSYLRRFPVDQLKVDRSFVDGLGTDPSDSAIVTAIITLAHTMGLEAVAEGVETQGQLNELRRLACDSAQGFLIARPNTAAEIEALLTTDKRW